MNWQEVVEHSGLRNLPFKIELNNRGQIVLTERKVLQSVYCSQINWLLHKQKQSGVCLVSCAIRTGKGTKIADAAWASRFVFEKIKDDLEATVAPEVCVEVLSSSNTAEEMNEKRELYFERGALEFWTCDEAGAMRFFDASGELEQSVLFADFPTRIEI